MRRGRAGRWRSGGAGDSFVMAGNLSPECGRGRWGDSSLLGRRLSEDSSRQQLLEKWESVWSSAGEVSAEKAPREEESPLVFLCSRCRRPLGDSLSWVTCLEDTNCILLRCQFGLGIGGGHGGPGVPAARGTPHLHGPEAACSG